MTREHGRQRARNRSARRGVAECGRGDAGETGAVASCPGEIRAGDGDRANDGRPLLGCLWESLSRSPRLLLLPLFPPSVSFKYPSPPALVPLPPAHPAPLQARWPLPSPTSSTSTPHSAHSSSASAHHACASLSPLFCSFSLVMPSLSQRLRSPQHAGVQLLQAVSTRCLVVQVLGESHSRSFIRTRRVSQSHHRAAGRRNMVRVILSHSRVLAHKCAGYWSLLTKHLLDMQYISMLSRASTILPRSPLAHGSVQ